MHLYYLNHLSHNQALNIEAHLLKARIVESQQPAVTRQRPIKSNKGIVFSAETVLMAAQATM
jgi:hypothetical protein